MDGGVAVGVGVGDNFQRSLHGDAQMVFRKLQLFASVFAIVWLLMIGKMLCKTVSKILCFSLHCVLFEEIASRKTTTILPREKLISLSLTWIL